MKSKFILCGLPRSGTTIITRFFMSIPGIYCLSERHWEYVRSGKISGGEEDDYIKIVRDNYEPDSKFPLNKSIELLLEEFKYVGFKETYRSSLYTEVSKTPNFSNQQLMENYRDNKEYDFFVILRNPIDVFNSWIKFDLERKSHTSDLDLFIKGYSEFINNFATGENTIMYEKFVDNPKGIFEEVTKLELGDEEIVLSKRNIRGDEIANNTEKIEKINRKDFLKPEEKQKITNSEAFELFKSFS